MKFICKKSDLNGKVQIPGSKSHTIRAVTLGMLANGTSIIRQPLISNDAQAAVTAAKVLGTQVNMYDDYWEIKGCNGVPAGGDGIIDVGNSGTTMRIMMGMAALVKNRTLTLTGDAQVRRRPSQPLAEALRNLGTDISEVAVEGGTNYLVKGGLTGGTTHVDGKTSQYVSSLLIACTQAPETSELIVPRLNEKPYVQITLDWLERLGLKVDYAPDFSRFVIPGNQKIEAFDKHIPADFSTATFFLTAGSINNNSITSMGLDITDSQPDKSVINYLKQMGANIEVNGNNVKVDASKIHGCKIDMNETPDALPAISVLACFAEGETVLYNVAHARLKETDRIKVMCSELSKMGADIEEMPDGLKIRKSELTGCEVSGHDDHRVVMSLAIAGMSSPGTTTIGTAEAASVTYPEFAAEMQRLGGDITIKDKD